MQDTIRGLTKEQVEEVIMLFQDCMDDYLYLMDLKNDYYRISKRALERFMVPSVSFEDATETHKLFVYEEDQAMIAEDLRLIHEGKKKEHNLHYRWLDKSGRPVWINCCGQVIDDAEGRPAYLIGCINETGRKQRADNVSGLLDAMELASYLAADGEEVKSGFLMRIGIDDFSAINGTLGMEYGDHVLKGVADCIRMLLTENQRLFHIVADEFMVIDFGGHTAEDAITLYTEIKKGIAAFIDAERYKAVFTVSAGIVEKPEMYGDYDVYQKLSEFTLKQAKDSGKNCFYVFLQEDYDCFLRKRRVRRALHHAVNNAFEGFEVFYQPIVDCKTYRLLGAEALMRFSMPSAGGEGRERVSPMEFIPLLEETGLILPAGRWILDQAFAMCSEMQQAVPGFKINVNISYIQVIKSNILKDIVEAIERHQLSPECVGVEMTESGYLDSNPHFLRLWDGLKENGIKLILDDFGTGYSNLHCLSDLNPTYIKVDRDFTNRAMQSTYDYELMVKIIEMAHSLNLQICVEGIEKAESLDEIRKIQVDYIQGYLFGMPCCKEEFCERFV